MREAFGHRLYLEHEPFTRERAGNARALAGVRERDEETLLTATRGDSESVKRPRAIGVWHRARAIVPNRRLHRRRALGFTLYASYGCNRRFGVGHFMSEPRRARAWPTAILPLPTVF